MRPLLVVALLFGAAHAQPKPPEKKDLPIVVVATPLGVPASKDTKILLRGLRLDTATKVEFAEGVGEVKILRKGKVGVPNQAKAEHYGDTEVEVQLTAPAGKDRFNLVVTTPAGKSGPHAILIDGPEVIAEKEPNNGYRTAQEVKIGQTVAGTIASNQDVDCYKFEGEAGQGIVAEVLANRLGSPLDAVLTLTDDGGQIVAQADDLPDSRDARIEVKLPRKGTYYLTLQDAHDVGSNVHGYRLQLRVK
jgi:hypothetical protein